MFPRQTERSWRIRLRQTRLWQAALPSICPCVSLSSSASETARWYIVGSLDPETKTINYTGASKANVTYDESGEITEEESVYDDGTGTVVFNDDGTFTWHEDQSESGEDMVFAWLSPLEEE